jgi:biopolymer transport protein ExbD
MGMTTGNKSSTPNINVTPLIDVLLVLLIIFMVVTPLKPNKFETKIPEKPTPEIETLPASKELLVLTVDNERKLYLNTQMISAEDLGVRIEEILEARPSDRRTIFVRAPKSLPYGFVVNLIDIVKGAGASPIGLQIDYLDQI